MISTKDFRTKTILREQKNPTVDGYWPIGLDIGYSSVKVYSPNTVSCVPSYAKRVKGSVLSSKADADEILYRDDQTGELWKVGSTAQNMISASDSSDSDEELFGRNRYFSPVFRVISRVGIALGKLNNNFGSPKNQKVIIQTGLPPKYRKSDSSLLKEALSGTHRYSVKIGNRSWQDFSFELKESDIRVTDQPMGTLYSISTNNNGDQVKDAYKYFKSNTLIVDPGFGTCDFISVSGGVLGKPETFQEYGMKRVLEETSKVIFDRYHQEISVAAMQKYLERGSITCFDRKTMSSTEKAFNDILEKCSVKVFNEVMENLKTIYNYLSEQEYLVITGGAGAAWEKLFREYLSGLSSLHIINGMINDPSLPLIFSNVRGYYNYLYSYLKTKRH